MKAALMKMTRVGRTTILCVALAVAVTATVGVASPATAAKAKKAVFELGKSNTVKAVSSMAGSLTDPILRLDNNGTGSALDLQVESGKAPLTVNSTAGTATNLSSDKLDGKDSTAFFSGKSYTVERELQGPGGGTNRVVSADCDSGDRVLGGGGTGDTSQEDVVLSSQPFGQGWDVVVDDKGSASLLQAFAVCADFPPLR